MGVPGHGLRLRCDVRRVARPGDLETRRPVSQLPAIQRAAGRQGRQQLPRLRRHLSWPQQRHRPQRHAAAPPRPPSNSPPNYPRSQRHTSTPPRSPAPRPAALPVPVAGGRRPQVTGGGRGALLGPLGTSHRREGVARGVAPPQLGCAARFVCESCFLFQQHGTRSTDRRVASTEGRGARGEGEDARRRERARSGNLFAFRPPRQAAGAHALPVLPFPLHPSPRPPAVLRRHIQHLADTMAVPSVRHPVHQGAQ